MISTSSCRKSCANTVVKNILKDDEFFVDTIDTTKKDFEQHKSKNV